MERILCLFAILLAIGCKSEATTPSAQAIVDKAITVSGGECYEKATIAFAFRDYEYSSQPGPNGRVYTRSLTNDSIQLKDVLAPAGLQRFIHGKPVPLPDSTANTYANSVNSVHYFAYLPYRLNDAAVHKELLGKVTLKGQEYWKLRVTFAQEGGGDDYDDVYVYWFNTKTFKPDYLAYSFHVDGGGYRFREAFNERYVGDIRFVDYKNFAPKDTTGIQVEALGSLYEKGQLELLSTIVLEEVEVW